MEFTREILFSPAFDKRDPDPSKNYGIHGMELTFYLKGDEGAVQFKLFTGWDLPHVRAEHKDSHTLCNIYPMPADLGYHSRKPVYDDQKPRENCHVLDGQPCYYDGSGLNAEPVFDLLVTEGHEAVWVALENYYQETFPTNEPSHP